MVVHNHINEVEGELTGFCCFHCVCLCMCVASLQAGTLALTWISHECSSLCIVLGKLIIMAEIHMCKEEQEAAAPMHARCAVCTTLGLQQRACFTERTLVYDSFMVVCTWYLVLSNEL
jgi:hypothetical protein